MSDLVIPSPENPYRDVKYIAESLAVRDYTVREWLREKKMKGIRDNETGAWKVLHSDFVEFCEERFGANG